MEAHFFFAPGGADILIMFRRVLPGGIRERNVVRLMPGEDFMGIPYDELAEAQGGVISMDATASTAKISIRRAP